ncbi:MAG: nuclear transport factor 2 family protein [Acidobacteriota bacterium]
MIKQLVLATAAAFALSACGAPASNSPANAANTSNSNVNAAKAVAAAPTKDALMALEKSAYEAWKTKDAKFWDPFLSAKFVGYGSTGKLDRAAAIKEYSGADCDIKSYTHSDEQMTPLGTDAALLTYKVAVDGTCGGHKVPANSWAAGVYVREGDKWKGAFHAESPIPDSNAKPDQAAASTTKPAATTSAPEPKPDAATDALIALEKKAWDDWKNKNAKGLDEWAGKDFVAFTSKGRSDRATALKTWAEDGCEVKSVSLTDPASVSLSPDFSLLTFKAGVDGKCQGSAIPSENGISIYGKEGGAWKALFTMGTPIM